MEGSRDTELPNQFLGLRNFAPLVFAFMSPQQPEQFQDMTWILQHWDIVFVLGKGSKKDEGRLEIAINCNIVQVHIVYCIYMSYIRIYIYNYISFVHSIAKHCSCSEAKESRRWRWWPAQCLFYSTVTHGEWPESSKPGQVQTTLQRPDGDARASTTTWTDFVLYVSSSNSPCVESEEYYECLLWAY